MANRDVMTAEEIDAAYGAAFGEAKRAARRPRGQQVSRSDFPDRVALDALAREAQRRTEVRIAKELRERAAGWDELAARCPWERTRGEQLLRATTLRHEADVIDGGEQDVPLVPLGAELLKALSTADEDEEASDAD